uniref:Uncharacterized protein n=1 Tax=Lepeophtheirus salmonis TaxID=72036 RepID=A0A0K2V3M5_LEPSM
MFILQTIFNM